MKEKKTNSTVNYHFFSTYVAGLGSIPVRVPEQFKDNVQAVRILSIN